MQKRANPTVEFDPDSRYLVTVTTAHHISAEAYERLTATLEKKLKDLFGGAGVKVILTETPLSIDFWQFKPGRE